MAQSLEIMPLETAQVRLARLGAMLLEQVQHLGNIGLLPGLFGHSHVGRVQRALQAVGQSRDLVALLLSFVALRGCLLGFRLGFLRASFGLRFVGIGLGLGCRGSDGLPGADRGAENQAGGDCGSGCESGFVFAGDFLEAVQGSGGQARTDSSERERWMSAARAEAVS